MLTTAQRWSRGLGVRVFGDTGGHGRGGLDRQGRGSAEDKRAVPQNLLSRTLLQSPLLLAIHPMITLPFCPLLLLQSHNNSVTQCSTLGWTMTEMCHMNEVGLRLEHLVLMGTPGLRLENSYHTV